MMFSLFCKRVIQGQKRESFVRNLISHLGFIQFNQAESSIYNVARHGSSESFKVKETLSTKKKLKPEDEYFCAISFLIDRCGLSVEDAVVVSRTVNFKSRKNVDSICTLLRNHGFTDTQISKCITGAPKLLASSSEKTLFPKIDFFSSKGVSNDDIAFIFTSNPILFFRSLENQIIPCYNILKSLVIDDKNVVKAFKRSDCLFRQNLKKNLISNMNVLKELEVPQSAILLLISHYPGAACLTHHKFVDIVQELKKMGFDPLKSSFVKAIHMVSCVRMPAIEAKFEFYGKWGWSKDDAICAFKRQPDCMVMSEKNIERTMNILVKKMGWPSKLFAQRPVILCFSLEKRIIPRCLVIQVLRSTGLLKNDLSLTTFFSISDERFLLRFVKKYENCVPKLMDLYEGKVSIHDLASGLDDLRDIEDSYNW